MSSKPPRSGFALAAEALSTSLIEVRASPIHGLGVFALHRLQRFQRIGTYAGKRYPTHSVRPDSDGPMTFLFALSDGSHIDGSVGGNATRHINHHCSPNVLAIEYTNAQGELGVQFLAKREIAAGRELFLDYSLDLVGEDPAAYPCLCRHRKCRGTLAAVL